MNRVRLFNKQLQVKIDRFENICSMLGGKGISYEGVRVQTSLPDGSTESAAIAEAYDLEQEIIQDVRTLDQLRGQVTKMIIGAVNDAEAELVALMYYADCRSTAQIKRYFNKEGDRGRSWVKRKRKIVEDAILALTNDPPSE